MSVLVFCNCVILGGGGGGGHILNISKTIFPKTDTSSAYHLSTT